MLRIIAAACVGIALPASMQASEVCVACEAPAATYRCSLDRTSMDGRVKLGDFAERKVCEKVLSRLGRMAHARWSVRLLANRTTKSITLADYQRALTDSSEHTYQPSVLEKAHRAA